MPGWRAASPACSWRGSQGIDRSRAGLRGVTAAVRVSQGGERSRAVLSGVERTAEATPARHKDLAQTVALKKTARHESGFPTAYTVPEECLQL
jgi:hypothetical protein